MVSRLGGVVSGLGFVLGVDSFSFVGYIGDVSILVGGVGHHLDAAVRKSDSVRAGSFVSVSCLGMTKIGAAVIILDGIVKSVFWGNSVVLGFMVGRGRCVVGSGSGLVSGSRCGVVCWRRW